MENLQAKQIWGDNLATQWMWQALDQVTNKLKLLTQKGLSWNGKSLKLPLWLVQVCSLSVLPEGELSLEQLQRQSNDFSLKSHCLPSIHAPHGNLMGMLLGLCYSSDFCLLPSFNKSKLFLFRRKWTICCLSEEGLSPSSPLPFPHSPGLGGVYGMPDISIAISARSKADLRLSVEVS